MEYKPVMIKSLIFALLVSILSFSSIAFADGGVISGGGDRVAAEFIHTARMVNQLIADHPDLKKYAAEFSEAIEQTRVISKPKLIWKNQEVEAINYPTRDLIEVSRSYWLSADKISLRTYALVAHEYFGIMGLNDRSYQLSQALFEPQRGKIQTRVECSIYSDAKQIGGPYSLSFSIFSSGPKSDSDIYVMSFFDEKQRRNRAMEKTMQWFLADLDFRNGTIAYMVQVSFFLPRMIQFEVRPGFNGRVDAPSWDVHPFKKLGKTVKESCYVWSAKVN